ncbi:hypothetical protein B0H13DRAFT_2305647 [Mycena leptocephala]|nr:hypothetical protein B0H13DRAFT_2305647 [Mycena leptocephala]
MSTSKTFPNGLRLNKSGAEHHTHKRKRETTGGGSVVTQTSYSDPGTLVAAKSMAGTLAGPQLPYQWSRILSEIEATGSVVPPASVIDFFVEEHSRCLSGFKNAQEALQRALATQKKFAESSSTGLVPSAVLNSVEMPYVQVMKLAIGIETDLVVTAANTLAEKELLSAAVSCTKYLSALYEVQVSAIRDKTKVANIADEFADALTAIGASIMSNATGGDGAVWAPSSRA